MSFLADYDDLILKYNKSWKIIKKLRSVEFDSQPVYDEKYIKTRANIFEDKVITKFTDNELKLMMNQKFQVMNLKLGLNELNNLFLKMLNFSVFCLFFKSFIF